MTRPGELLSQLDQIRQVGYATDDEENESAIRCLAAPVRNSQGAVVSGVGMSTVAFLMPLEELLGWSDAVQATAAELSRIFW